ncbi:hypothetical protein ACLEJQ_16830 [Pseudomonas sp. SMV71]|uniref:hypothetical protein n=1 Tax=Pseudomonas sp. SMV71 TaxID=3390195 RepID=UPI003F8647FB
MEGPLEQWQALRWPSISQSPLRKTTLSIHIVSVIVDEAEGALDGFVLGNTLIPQLFRIAVISQVWYELVVATTLVYIKRIRMAHENEPR